MAIREYIETRSRMEGEDEDSNGHIIRSGLPDSPVQMADSPEAAKGGGGGDGGGETKDGNGSPGGGKGSPHESPKTRQAKLRTPGHGDASASLEPLSVDSLGSGEIV